MSAIPVNPEWWKTLFDSLYLVTDARSVCDHEVTAREVTLIENVLNPGKQDRILDFCGGQGRHSLELSRRGYMKLVVLDYSYFLVNTGKKLAEEEGLPVFFYQAEARTPAFSNDSFDTVMIMANSFGYFLDDRENQRILHEVRRILKGGGRLLLDLSDGEYVVQNFKPRTWHRATDDILVCRERELSDNRVYARELIISKEKGLIKENTYCERLFDRRLIQHFLKNTGFWNIEVQRNFSSQAEGDDYGFMTRRMIVTAKKQ